MQQFASKPLHEESCKERMPAIGASKPKHAVSRKSNCKLQCAFKLCNEAVVPAGCLLQRQSESKTVQYASRPSPEAAPPGEYSLRKLSRNVLPLAFRLQLVGAKLAILSRSAVLQLRLLCNHPKPRSPLVGLHLVGLLLVKQVHQLLCLVRQTLVQHGP